MKTSELILKGRIINFEINLAKKTEKIISCIKSCKTSEQLSACSNWYSELFTYNRIKKEFESMGVEPFSYYSDYIFEQVSKTTRDLREVVSNQFDVIIQNSANAIFDDLITYIDKCNNMEQAYSYISESVTKHPTIWKNASPDRPFMLLLKLINK